MRLEEATREELLYCELWNEWLDDVTEIVQAGQTVSDRQEDLLIAYFEYSGLKPPKKGAPIVLMFRAFIAGVNAGIGLMRDLEQDEKEEKP